MGPGMRTGLALKRAIRTAADIDDGYDQITVTGNVAVGGELEVTLRDRFLPRRRPDVDWQLWSGITLQRKLG